MEKKKKKPDIVKQNDTETDYTAAQERLLEVMLNPECRHLAITQICAKAKCSRATYYRACKDNDFFAHYKEDLRALARSYIGPVIHAFAEQAKRGSFPHGKVILEMGGMYTEASDITLRNPPGEAFHMKNVQDMMKELSDEQLAALADMEIEKKKS